MSESAMQREFEYLDERTGEVTRVRRTFYFSSHPGDVPTKGRLAAFPHLEEGEQHLEKANGEIVIVRLATPRQRD